MQTYGKVTSQQLEEQFDKVNATIYNPTLPIDSIFNAIIDLSELAEAATIPYTLQQQMTIAYNMLNRSGRMAPDIKEWNRSPIGSKTWDNFKTHFRRAHIELRETSSDTLQALQQANIAQKLIEVIVHLIPPPAGTTTQVPPAEAPSLADTATSSLTDLNAFSVTNSSATIIPSLIQQIGTMQTMMTNMQSSMCGNTVPGGRGRRCMQGRGARQGGAQRGRRNPAHQTHYCWTHGMCMHNGAQCSAPAEGHEPTATVANRLQGSNRNLT